MIDAAEYGKIRWYGNNIPFLSNGSWLSFQQDERLIKNDLLQLLLTSPGERVMKPNFGTNIRRFMFENITEARLKSLRSNISTAIERYEPRVNVKNLDVREIGENAIAITIQASLITDPSREFFFQVQLQFDSVSKTLRQRVLDVNR